MSEPKQRRIFSPRFKLGVVERMEAGESATALSRELKIRRHLLYDWQRLWRREGADAMRRPGRPAATEALLSGGAPPKSLAEAERKIAELERKIGQQALELDFFGRALQRIEESRRASETLGGPASSRTSKR
jgi:transposase-like protein